MKRYGLENITNFNKATGQLFAKLYERFPKVLLYLDAGDFGSEIGIEDTDIIKQSVEFLEVEGFIRIKSASGSGQFSKVGLTLKGLSALQKTPKSIDEKQTSLGESISKKIKEGSWDIAINLTSQVLGGAV